MTKAIMIQLKDGSLIYLRVEDEVFYNLHDNIEEVRARWKQGEFFEIGNTKIKTDSIYMIGFTHSCNEKVTQWK